MTASPATNQDLPAPWSEAREDLAVGKAAHEYQVGLLGGSGPGRVDALETWLRGMIGDRGQILSGKRGPNGQVAGGVFWTADIISAFEALQNRFRSQGAAGYTGNGRDTGANDGKIPGYDKMDFAQRRQAQDQLAARRPGR